MLLTPDRGEYHGYHLALSTALENALEAGTLNIDSGFQDNVEGLEEQLTWSNLGVRNYPLSKYLLCSFAAMHITA